MRMLVPTLIMGGVAIILLAIGLSRGQGEAVAGLRVAGSMLWQIIPLLIFAFIMAGMIQVLVPQELIARWVGDSSGWRGIMLGSVAGGLAPGGPYVSLPIAAGLMRSGAGVGTMVAFLTGWSLWSLGRLPMEVGILGWRLTLIRFASVLVFPPLAGFIAQFFFGKGT
jgi:uncharacterized protein